MYIGVGEITYNVTTKEYTLTKDGNNITCKLNYLFENIAKVYSDFKPNNGDKIEIKSGDTLIFEYIFGSAILYYFDTDMNIQSLNIIAMFMDNEFTTITYGDQTYTDIHYADGSMLGCVNGILKSISDKQVADNSIIKVVLSTGRTRMFYPIKGRWDYEIKIILNSNDITTNDNIKSCLYIPGDRPYFLIGEGIMYNFVELCNKIIKDGSIKNNLEKLETYFVKNNSLLDSYVHRVFINGMIKNDPKYTSDFTMITYSPGDAANKAIIRYCEDETKTYEIDETDVTGLYEFFGLNKLYKIMILCDGDLTIEYGPIEESIDVYVNDVKQENITGLTYNSTRNEYVITKDDNTITCEAKDLIEKLGEVYSDFNPVDGDKISLKSGDTLIKEYNGDDVDTDVEMSEDEGDELVSIGVEYNGNQITGFTYNKNTGKYYYKDEEFDVENILYVLVSKAGQTCVDGMIICTVDEMGIEIPVTLNTDYTVKYRKDKEWKDLTGFSYNEEDEKVLITETGNYYTLDELKDYLGSDEGYAIVVLNGSGIIKSSTGKWEEGYIEFESIEDGGEFIDCERIGNYIRKNEESSEYFLVQDLAYSQFIFGKQRNMFDSVTIDDDEYTVKTTEMYLEYTTYRDTYETMSLFEWMGGNKRYNYIIDDDNQTLIEHDIAKLVEYYCTKGESEIYVPNGDVFTLYKRNGKEVTSFTMSDSGWNYCKLYVHREEKDLENAIFNKEKDGIYSINGNQIYSFDDISSMGNYCDIYDLSGNLLYRYFNSIGYKMIFGYQNSTDVAEIQDYASIAIINFIKGLFFYSLEQNGKGTIYSNKEIKSYLESRCGKSLDYLSFILHDDTNNKDMTINVTNFES